MKDLGVTSQKLDQLVKLAAAAMKVRSDAKKQDDVLDDFKVDFKRESELRELAKKAREYYLVANTTKN
jgi:hypothetical protein